MTLSLQSVIAELMQGLKELYGDRLVHVVLFGSQARGDASEGSDIDILVVLQGPVRAGREISRAGEITASLSLRHDVVISCTFVSAERYELERSPLLMNIHKEGVMV